MDQSSALLCLQLPVFVLSVWLLVRRGSLAKALRSLSGRRRFWLLAAFSIFPVNLVLTALDPYFSRAVGRDFAFALASWEEPLASLYQSWTPAPFTAFCALVYTAGFPALIAAAVVEGLAEGRAPFRLVAIALLANYVLALPFYFFIPVSEVHAVLPAVRNLLAEASPELADFNRPASGIDNCFPSLHTSITIAMLLAMPELRLRASVLGGLIVFTTLYLGIHWTADVVAGIGFGVLCRQVAGKFAGVGWSHEKRVPFREAYPCGFTRWRPLSSPPVLSIMSRGPSWSSSSRGGTPPGAALRRFVPRSRS